MKRTRLKRVLSFICIAMLLAALFPAGNAFDVSTAAETVSFSDTRGHWAEESIRKWAERGIIQGSGGRFRPNDNVTRAELAAILNRLLKYPDQPDNPFDDFDERAWYFQDVNNLSAIGAFHITGSSFKGNENITRQEAAHIIAISFGMRSSRTSGRSYRDASQVDSWAVGYVNHMFTHSFVRGDPDGNFRPHGLITRAEITTMLDNIVGVIIDKPGTYSNFPSGSRILITTGDVLITSDDPRTSGRLHYFFLAPSVGDGLVTLNENIFDSNYYIVGSSEDILIRNNTGGSRPYFTFLPTGSGGDERFIGAGSAISPYLISNAEQLKLLTEFVGARYSSVHFALAADIRLTEDWQFIGTGTSFGANYFAGNLDGRNHTISNIKITDSRGGLFYSISGVVKNLNLEGEITAGGGSTGLLASSLEGRAENCSVKVEINLKGADIHAGGLVAYASGAVIENCTVSGNIKTASNITYRSIINDVMVGGLCGQADERTKIINCKSSVNISSEVKSAVVTYVGIGGLVGEGSYIENSSATGNVELKFEANRDLSPAAGGLVGRLVSGSVINSHATGNVKSEGGYYNFAGGLIGLAGNFHERKSVTVEKSYATGSVSSSGARMQNNAGGFVGQLENGSISESWSKGRVSASGTPGYFNAVGGFAGSCYDGGTISNSYTVSNVSVTGNRLSTGAFVGRLVGNIENSYAAGDTDTVSFVGSARGNPVLTNCGDFFRKSAFYPSFYTGSGEASGASRVTEAQLTSESTYTLRGWDFTNVWTFAGSGNYKLPVLRNVNVELQSRN